MDREYQIILADPPWKYRVGEYGRKSGKRNPLWGLANRHYETMSNEEIYEYLDGLDLSIAADAVLFLWCTNPHLQTGLNTIERWGFEYKTNIVWVKTDRCAGIGYYVRGQHELLLFGVRGRMQPEKSIAPPIGSVIRAPRRRHSEKPEEAYELIERMYPGARRIELFARKARVGWEQMGDELERAG